MVNQHNLSKAIFQIRQKMNLTQGNFAERLNVTRQAVSRWETGETTPTIDTLKTMVDLFRVDICSLLGTVCQSCTMKIVAIDDLGTNSDNSINADYCKDCFAAGNLLPVTFDEMINGYEEYFDNPTPEGKEKFKQQLATLKRWRKGE